MKRRKTALSLSVTYNEEYLTRYVLDLKLKNRSIEGILDTACSTSLIPLNIANKLGKPLNHKADITVGGNKYKAQLYLLEKLQFGTFLIKEITMFSANYKGLLKNRMLIGNNVLFNLEILLVRNGSGVLKFEFKPYWLVKNKEKPFIFFFSSKEQRPLYPDELLVEDSTGEC